MLPPAVARFDSVRSPDSEWQTKFKQQFPTGAGQRSAIEHLLRTVIFYVNDVVTNARLVRHSPRLSISRLRQNECFLTITIYKRTKRISAAWNHNTILLDDQFVALDHPGGPVALINALTDRIEKFWEKQDGH